MSQKIIGRIAGGAIATAALVGFGGGVAQADEAPNGAIQEAGHAVHGVEKETGVADASKKIDDATGVTTIDDETGVTKAEDGLGLG
ncbi:hypothetical protein LQ327_13405 [Actinomycetospora endophytica]|uniref:Uncharacterized protein n=1 Tax=Actinomycetospora endophytica TaxID=2291215 RepID=A0ABS8P7X7_9PSEU|nr:hypothetical protein [Actinomycetospora endophytica]MCD2194370.1 hypothetical protein [Actinomycetospora endophytica]